MEKVDRRTFLRRGIITALAVAALPSVLACGPEGVSPQEVNRDQLSPEQTKLLKHRTWQSLTEVLNGDLFSEDSLVISQVLLTKGHNPKIAAEDINILGSLRGQSRQLGVQFRVTYGKDVTYGQEPLKLDFGDNTLTLGEDLGKGLQLEYFIGENAGDVLKKYVGRTVRDPQGMQKRFEDMQVELRRVSKIPDNTPFIPHPDFNGIVTFVGNHRTGYGLYMESAKEGIDGKGVTIDMTEGLLTDTSAWVNTAKRFHNHVSPDQISFKGILRVALDDLEDKYGQSLTSFRYLGKDKSYAAEYIRQLGSQYLPNQDKVSAK